MTYFINKIRAMQLSVLIVCFLTSQNATGQLSLPWTEDFEGATPGTYTTNQNPIPGLTGVGYSWEVQLGANGRARTSAGAAYSNGGSQAITLDAATNGTVAINYLIANLDLSNYGGTNDLELIFNYGNHGEENSTNDRVWMRGSSANAWVEVYNLYANRPGTGQYAQVTLDIDALMQTAGQTITSTFQLRFGQEDNFQAASPTSSDGFSFDDISITGSLPLPNNAGITAMLSPVLGAVAGSYPVDVTLNNFGNNALNNVTIYWSMNGGVPAQVNFTGPALAQSTSTTVNLSASTPFATGLTNLRFWTSDPNGLPDPDNNNDTLDAFFCTGLAGTYTVGTAVSDFPTFQDALTALYGCGVGGPVTMQVQPGAYTTALVIDQPIPGISATNRVTWDGSAQAASITVNSGAAVTFDGADYMTVQNFLLANTTTTLGWGVLLTNEANHNEILNNRIQMAVTNAFNTSGIVASASPTSVSSSGNNANYTLIEGNVITGADRGISLYGTFTTNLYNSGNIIRNNDISDADNYGIYAYYQDSIMISGNHIHDLPSTFHYGIYTYYLMNFDVVGNNINVTDYGIYFNRSNSQITPTRQALIANNMVQSATDRGIYLFFTRETDFYHNTIVSAASACIWSNFDNTVDVKNNIFVSTSNFNYAFETFTTNVFADMDYNAFYKNPANPNLIDFGGTFTDLADWQTNGANTYDQNSLEGLPTFISATDLHVDGAFLNDRGIATTAVLTDIDGDVRPAIGATSVDIGADEFTPPLNDAGVLDLASPTLPIVGGFASVEVVIRNYGIAPLNSFMVGWTIDGVVQTPVPYSGATIPVGGNTNMILANLNFPTSTTSLEFWTSMPNGVTDERPSNDTLTVGICPGLAGTYSVGHSSSDYPTVSAALDALMSCGVSGPVTMEFAAGTYNGPWVLTEIPGASLANTVTFDGLNSANAIITHDASGPNGAATVTFDGVDYFTIKNFRIENTGTAAPVYGVLFTNAANYNTIDNNEIIVPTGTTTNIVGVLTSNSYTASVGTAAEGNNANYTTISNNDISGGVANVILEGGISNFENIGNKIMDNNMHDADDFGIYVDEQDSLVISGNTIYDLTAANADAVQLYDIRNFSILANDITSRDYGIAIFGGFAAGDEVTNGLIANNMVLTGTNGEAFYLREANAIYIYHNTFSGTRACWLDNHFNIDLRNNILNATTGECFYTLDPVSMSGMDHNLYFVSGVGGRAVRFGTQTYVTLADWQTTGVGYDLNSVSGNPNFVNGLYIGGSLPVDTADVTLTFPITTDINGDPRPLGLKPDIGADEHVVIANDAMIVGLKSPDGCGSAVDDVIISIANVGSTLILTAPITVNVTGAAVATFNASHPILLSGITIDKNMGSINTEAGGVFNFEIIISAGTDTNPSNDTLRTSVTILPSNQMALSMVGDTTVCDSSTAMIAALASYSPATVLWYDAPVGGNLVHIGNGFTTPNLSGTTMYYAEIQGCASPRAVATVDVDVFGIQVNLGADQTICDGAAATLTPAVTSSVATSSIWSDGSQSAFIEATASGLYTATVMNAYGCMDTDTVEVTVSAAPTVADVTGNVSCGGVGDGAIDLTLTGGTGPYSYQWSTSATTEDVAGLSGGFYNVTITDNGTASNCAYVMSYQVTEPLTLSANVDVASVACNGNDGSIDITVSGGSPNYTYNWSTSATTEDLTNAPAGTHTVSITDANGCETTATGTVTATTPIVITIDTIYAEILAIAGGIEITATGGTGTLQYTWNTGATTDDLTGLVAGTYDVTVTDLATGCQQVLTGIVVPYQLPDFVNTIPSLDMFKLYPNPTSDRVFVNIVLTETTEVQLEVMSITGQVLQSFEPRANLEQNYEINMTDYPSGVYLARFVIDNKVITEKIIVE
jgi:hypothetical protein